MNYSVKNFHHIKSNGKSIWGRLFRPVNFSGKTVVYCHFFAKNSDQFLECLPPFLEEGAQVYLFDFCGGSNDSRSEGGTEEMSVLTELDDLLTVMRDLKKFSETADTVFYGAGMSQGGYVVTLAASRYPGMFKKLFLANPAFVIGDYVRASMGPNGEYTKELWGHRLGDIYTEDAMSVDIYSEMSACQAHVVIMHGSRDRIVPVSYSERAMKVLPDAELVILEGATHMMRDHYAVECAEISAHEMARD